MSIEDSKEAYLWPFNVQMGFTLRLEYVEDDWDSVLIVLPDDALVCICCVRFNHSTLLLRCFCRLMILQEESLWIEYRWIFTKEQCLYFDKLDILVLRFMRGKLGLISLYSRVVSIRFFFLTTLSCCWLAFLCWVCVGWPRRILCRYRLRWTTGGSSWWESQTRSMSNIIIIAVRWRMRRWRQWLLVTHVRGVIVVRVDT